MRDAADARADAEHSLAEVKAEYERAVEQMETSQADGKASEQALDDALAEARDLRAKLIAAEAALKEAEASMRAMREKADLEDSELVRELKATHSHQIWEMEQNMRELELTMAKTHAIARENAERMMRHNERMGRVVGKMDVDADIPVKFEIVVDTMPGQRVAMVGTWNDWEVESAFPMRWTEGNLWTVTTPIHADDTYEYKYVIIDDNLPDPMANVQWQMGNNRTLALQLSLHDEVVLVEVVDSWSPDPKSMPILLHELDGTIKEVGSTQLLRDRQGTPHRTSHPRRIAEPPRAPGDRHEPRRRAPRAQRRRRRGRVRRGRLRRLRRGGGGGGGTAGRRRGERRLLVGALVVFVRRGRRARRERRHGRVRTQRRRHGDVRHVGVDGDEQHRRTQHGHLVI